MSARIKQFFEAVGVDITTGKGKRLVEQRSPTGLGIFDYHDDEDSIIQPEKFKTFLKKISANKQELDDDYSKFVEELRVDAKHDKTAKTKLLNLTASVDDYHEAKDKYKPYDMEIALSDIEKRYKEIQRYIELKNT